MFRLIKIRSKQFIKIIKLKLTWILNFNFLITDSLTALKFIKKIFQKYI